MISKQKTSCMILGLLVITMLIFPCISAFGASIDYNAQEKPLYLSPGESKDFTIALTASPGKPTTTRVELKKGAEIARFIGGNRDYNIPAGGAVTVGMNVKIPDAAVEGTEYIVSFLLTDVTSGAQQGTVGVGSSSEISFKVIVKTSETPAEPEKPNNTFWWILLIILIAVALVIYFYYRKKGSAKRR